MLRNFKPSETSVQLFAVDEDREARRSRCSALWTLSKMKPLMPPAAKSEATLNNMAIAAVGSRIEDNKLAPPVPHDRAARPSIPPNAA